MRTLTSLVESIDRLVESRDQAFVSKDYRLIDSRSPMVSMLSTSLVSTLNKFGFYSQQVWSQFSLTSLVSAIINKSGSTFNKPG